MYASLPHRGFSHCCYGIPISTDHTARSSLCLCGLLRNTVRRVLTELPSSAYVTGGAGRLLPWVGLVVNTVIVLRAARV
jgi:hypothetical protein